jgi:magnesium chelatase accessory protein
MWTTEEPIWERDGHDWPNREASRFVKAAGLRWHVQIADEGPVILLVHGTGSSVHSFRDLIPLLSSRFTVVAPDLPGHGFTDRPPFRELSLAGMSKALSGLLHKLEVRPVVAVGHSAGAAILARMILDDAIAPEAMVSLNGALLPLRGLPRHLFAPAARLVARLPLLPNLVARRASDPEAIRKLIRDSGSRIDARGIELYRRLASNASHVSAAFGMMANWDLDDLARDLPRLRTKLLIVIGDNDLMVAPHEQRRIRALVPGAEMLVLPRLGHLAHEEQPKEIADLLIRLADAGKIGSNDACVRLS